MSSQQSQYKALVEAFIPKYLFQYFKIAGVKVAENKIQEGLDELNNPPSSRKNKGQKSFLHSIPILKKPMA